MNAFIRSIVLLSVLYGISCQHTHTNSEKEKKEILLLDDQTRSFHFTKNAKAMAGILSDHFISVDNGVVSQPTYAESYQRFDQYFNRVEFLKWDNITPPIVRFSRDVSVAYVVIDKLVVLKEINKQLTDTTYFAWLSVYKKEDNKWVLDCIASTKK